MDACARFTSAPSSLRGDAGDASRSKWPDYPECKAPRRLTRGQLFCLLLFFSPAYVGVCAVNRQIQVGCTCAIREGVSTSPPRSGKLFTRVFVEKKL